MQNAIFFRLRRACMRVIVPTNRITVLFYNISSRHNGHPDFLCEWQSTNELMERINSNAESLVCNRAAAYCYWTQRWILMMNDFRMLSLILKFESLRTAVCFDLSRQGQLENNVGSIKWKKYSHAPLKTVQSDEISPPQARKNGDPPPPPGGWGVGRCP